MTTAPQLPRRVDRWQIRCRFNRAQYLLRSDFKIELTKRKPVIHDPAAPDPLPAHFKFTCEWVCRNTATKAKVADGHFYELADGSRTDPDPKHLLVGATKYALHSGTGWIWDVRRDFTVLLKRGGAAYWVYVGFRRWTCRMFGW